MAVEAYVKRQGITKRIQEAINAWEADWPQEARLFWRAHKLWIQNMHNKNGMSQGREQQQTFSLNAKLQVYITACLGCQAPYEWMDDKDVLRAITDTALSINPHRSVNGRRAILIGDR